jgi:hypothetical protein
MMISMEEDRPVKPTMRRSASWNAWMLGQLFRGKKSRQKLYRWFVICN